MNGDEVKKRTLLAISLLQAGDRDEAARILNSVIRNGPAAGNQWKSIGRLAAQIGEISLALEAARKFAATSPVKLSRLLEYWKELTTFGRSDLVEQEITRVRAQVGTHPAVLHVQGQIAAQNGEFAKATDLYLQVIRHPEFAAQGWFSLSMITRMSEHPDWIDRMLSVEKLGRSDDASGRARLLYGLGKAFHDCEDYARAIDCYTRGARARQSEAKYDADQLEVFARGIIREFTSQNLEKLSKPRAGPRASIFVNGLPRSGTTLVEQILVSHSQVFDGGEINLAKAALIPTVDYTFAGALRFNITDNAQKDRWGKIGRNYERMVCERFRSNSLIVDKSLTQSHIMGLIRHALPNCPTIWMRRNPADVAISCFRTLFTSPLAWCWRFEDIGHFFAVEDALFAHWTSIFQEEILTVDYQELVQEPATWIQKISDHAKLSWEPAMEQFHEKKRAVRTASLQQVRQPISTSAIGHAEPYARWMDGFWQSYEQTANRLKSVRG